MKINPGESVTLTVTAGSLPHPLLQLQWKPTVDDQLTFTVENQAGDEVARNVNLNVKEHHHG